MATNATTHGALSERGGKLSISWELQGDPGERTLHIVWEERGGPAVSAPHREGFGMQVLNRVFAIQTNAKADLAFAPEGITLVIDMPLGPQRAD